MKAPETTGRNDLATEDRDMNEGRSRQRQEIERPKAENFASRMREGEDPIQAPGAAIGEEPLPAFDEYSLLCRLLNDRDVAGAVIAGFLQDYPLQLSLLSKHLSEADAEGAKRQAHKMKGAAATISAVSLRALALEMEEAASAGKLECVNALLPRAAEEFERLKATLKVSGWLVQGPKREL
jgi:HPt (histidine-containing phosphotransfer) domain-containing protein